MIPKGRLVYLFIIILLDYPIQFSYLMRKIDHNELKGINGLDRVSTVNLPYKVPSEQLFILDTSSLSFF